jgi:hypothetical protein
MNRSLDLLSTVDKHTEMEFESQILIPLLCIRKSVVENLVRQVIQNFLI